jgi:hypothetical protein
MIHIPLPLPIIHVPRRSSRTTRWERIVLRNRKSAQPHLLLAFVVSQASVNLGTPGTGERFEASVSFDHGAELFANQRQQKCADTIRVVAKNNYVI